MVERTLEDTVSSFGAFGGNRQIVYVQLINSVHILSPWEGDQGEWIRAEYDPKAGARMDPKVDSDRLSQCEAKAE
jgi:hypothetical protein